jgi:hypothetical protein
MEMEFIFSLIHRPFSITVNMSQIKSDRNSVAFCGFSFPENKPIPAGFQYSSGNTKWATVTNWNF